MKRLSRDEETAVRIHALFLLGPIAGAHDAVAAALAREGADPFVRQAAFSGLAGRETPFLQELLRRPGWDRQSEGKALALQELSRVIAESRDAGAIVTLLNLISAHPDWIGAALVEGAAGVEKSYKPVRLSARPESLPGRMERLVTWEGDPNAPVEARALTDAERGRFERGREIYSRACMSCHRDDGRGFAAEAPKLAGTDWVLGPEGRLIRIALQGMAGPLEAAGERWNREMPPQETALGDEEVAAVLTYIRRAWGNEADPVEPKTVAAVRAAGETRATPWTAEELREID